MKYYKIEVERTYTTEVYVKCEDKETVEDVLNSSPTQEMKWEAQTNLWDYIFDAEMEQCDVRERMIIVDETYQTENKIFFDLDRYLKKTNA